MADNTVLNSGSGGDTIATDDIGGVKFPRSKLVLGADGTNDGDVSGTNPMPIKGTGSAGTPNSGVVTIQGISSGTAVAVNDNGGSLSVDDNGSTLSIDDGGGSLTVDGTVTIQDGGSSISIDDGGGSLTVDGTVAANVAPVTSGGLTISRTLSAASTNATSVKASAGQLYGWYLFNGNASTRYLKLYNKASAPTVGTDTPVLTIAIPGGAGANVEFTNGIAFGTGIAFALTTGAADSDTGAVAANEIIVNLLYK